MLPPRRFPALARIVPAACGPAALTLAIAAACWQAGPRDFLPLWNDEVVYWNEAAVFRRAGFEGGYITVNEQPAAAAFSRFGPHGPAFAAIFGTIGRIGGWRPYSGYLVNLVLVTICLGAWLLATRRREGFGARALLAITFWPLLIYLPTNMQEPLHFGLAFLFAALSEWTTASRWRAAAWTMLLVVACLTRPTWALIIPAAMWGRTPGWRRRAASVPLTIAVFVAAFVVVTRTAAPYPYTSWIPAAVADPANGIWLLLDATAAGVRAFTVPYREWWINALRLEVVAALAAGGALWAAMRRSDRRWRVEVALLALIPALLVMFPVGDIESGREFRILATHLLFGLLVVAGAGARWAAVPAVVNLLLLPTVMPAYVRLHEGRFAGGADVERFRSAVEGRLTFDADARTGWENTVLMHVDLLQAPLTGLPHGVGASYVLDWEDQALPPRSRYLLLREERDAVMRERLALVEIARTPLGTIYRNRGVRDVP